MRSKIRIWMLAAVIFVSASASGCSLTGLVGPNVNLSFIVPLGFGGSPGLFNPFGIVQAIVNAFLGEAFASSESSTSTAGGLTNPSIDAGTIGTIVS